MKIRYILQYYFDKGVSARVAAKEVNKVYTSAIAERTVQKWFSRFRDGNMDVKDGKHTGRPATTDPTLIMNKIQEDRHITIEEIALELGLGSGTVCNHMKEAGLKRRLHTWASVVLSETNLIQRISVCDTLLRRHEKRSFLHRIVVGDVKWMRYEDVVPEESPSTSAESQPGPSKKIKRKKLPCKKVLLCIWWDCKGLIHHELLPTGQGLNSDIYCQQLFRLKAAIEEKRPELVNRDSVLFHMDNARPYMSVLARRMIREFGWEVLPHPPSSPDMAPSDYYMFYLMQSHLGCIKIHTREACEEWAVEFFTNRYDNFYNLGIESLPSKWREIIEQNGEYLTMTYTS